MFAPSRTCFQVWTFNFFSCACTKEFYLTSQVNRQPNSAKTRIRKEGEYRVEKKACKTREVCSNKMSVPFYLQKKNQQQQKFGGCLYLNRICNCKCFAWIQIPFIAPFLWGEMLGWVNWRRGHISAIWGGGLSTHNMSLCVFPVPLHSCTQWCFEKFHREWVAQTRMIANHWKKTLGPFLSERADTANLVSPVK